MSHISVVLLIFRKDEEMSIKLETISLVFHISSNNIIIDNDCLYKEFYRSEYILWVTNAFQSVDGKMKFCFPVLFALILISCLHLGVALRCQSINQQTDQFEKILKTCRKRNLGHNNYDADYSSNESNESEDSSDSNEDSFDNKFLIRNNSRYYTNDFLNEQNNRNNKAHQSTRNGNPLSFGSNNVNERLKNVDYYDTNNWGMTNSNWENMRNTGSNHNYQENHNQKQNDSCIIQCFFNELNIIDQRGFPIRESMIRVMTERIQDPELRDFIEESIIKCFQFLNSVNRMEKCEYSQNLLTCLIGKGKEQCEDWNI
nr:uncharacterized protein DDB_G0283697 [Vespula vulgaris]